jgi:hypothetical protein
MLIGGTDEQHLVPLHPPEAGMDIGGQHRPGQIAKVLDSIDVGECGGDQKPGHGPL